MADRYEELRKRVEAATGPDREIDLLIGLTIDGWQIGDLIDGRFAPILGGTLVRDSSGNINVAAPGGMYPAPTESIDEALALVERMLPGAEYEITTLYGVAAVTIFTPFTAYGRREDGDVRLAILCALLRALEAKDTGRG